MGCLWDLLFIMTITPFVLGLIIGGVLPPSIGVFCILGLVLIRAVARGAGGAVSRAARMTFGIGVPLAALIAFAIVYSGGDMRGLGAILTSVGTLIIMLFGIYIMIRGLFA